MIPRRAAAGALALLLAGLGCHPMPATVATRDPIPATATAAATNADEVRELARLVNAHRARIGRSRLVWDDDLARVALRHSQDMARRHYFSHVNPDGLDPFDRLRAAGIRYRAAAENIGQGQRDADEMLDDWKSSPGHRRNLENGVYTRHGIGLYRRHWTHVFVREAGR